MFIRANTAIANVDYDSVSYDDLVEMSFDRVSQQRLDGSDDGDDAAWEAMLARKRRETYGTA